MDKVEYRVMKAVQFNPKEGKWRRGVHEVLANKAAFLDFANGSSQQIYTVLSGQEYELMSVVIDNRESSSVKVELFDATAGDPAAGTALLTVTCPPNTVLPLTGMRGYNFTSGVRGRVTTASAGVSIACGGRLAIKSGNN